MRKIVSVVIALSMSLAVLGGCGMTQSKIANDDSSYSGIDVVKIGTLNVPNDETLARQLDFFEEEMGCKVEMISFDSSMDVNVALASGDIDFGSLGSAGAATAIAQGIDVKAVWLHMIIASSEALAVQGDSDINKLEDLKGKSVATHLQSGM